MGAAGAEAADLRGRGSRRVASLLLTLLCVISAARGAEAQPAAGQAEGLDAEMLRHGWFAGDASAAVVFDTPPEDRWTAVWRAAGIDPAMLASVSGHS